MSSTETRKGTETGLSLSLATTRALILEDEKLGEVRLVVHELNGVAHDLEGFEDDPSMPGAVRVFTDEIIARVAGTVREEGELGKDFAIRIPPGLEEVVVNAFKRPGSEWQRLSSLEDQKPFTSDQQISTSLAPSIVLRRTDTASSGHKDPRIIINPTRR